MGHVRFDGRPGWSMSGGYRGGGLKARAEKKLIFEGGRLGAGEGREKALITP
jgi:hypothetical protein